MSDPSAISVLLVEDDAMHCDIVAARLRAADVRFDLRVAGTCEDALRRLSEETFDCVLLDHSLPDGTGDELLQRARDHLVTTPVVSFSTSVDSDVVLSEFKSGCADFLPKRTAFRGDQLVQTLLHAIDKRKTRVAVERSGSNAKLIEQARRILDFDHASPDSSAVTIPEKLQLIYETAFQNILDAVVLIERRSRIIFSNPALKRMLGLDADEDLPGHPLTTVDDVFSRSAAKAFQARRSDCGRYEATLRAVGGIDVPVLIGETRVGDDGVLCTISDLSRIKEHQRVLERKNKKLAELNELANKLVDNVSHEFRTPLTVIKGYSEVIQHGLAGPVSSEQHDCLCTILDRTRDLTQMVDDLLDTSKLRAGCLRVDRRPLHIEDVLDSVASSIAQKAAAHGINIHIEVEPGLPEVYADGEKVGRVILNLVVNAIKFSSEGSDVTLWARKEATERRSDGATKGSLLQSPSSTDIRIGVTDHGPGIAPEHLTIIFERFRQVGDPYRSSTKGFGLGLNIADELVALNYGRMHVESRLGEGSTFSFTVPVNDPAIVLERLFAHERHRDDRPLHIGLLTLAPRAGNALTDEMRVFAAAHTRPMDVIFDAPGGDALLIIGVAGDPRAWSQRLERAREAALREFDAPPDAALAVQVAGEWNFPGQRDRARREICAMLNAAAAKGATTCMDAC